MPLKEKIETDYNNSVKSKDKVQISTHRLILSSIKDLDIANRSGLKKKETDDEDIKKLLKKMLKQRDESIEIYKKNNRQDLLVVEQKEHEIISWYPVKDVLKQTSPVAAPWYPIPIPLKINLFSRTKTPVGICEIFFELIFFAFLINYNS